MRIWAWAMAIESLGWVTSALRGVIPEVVSVVIGNGFTALAVAGMGDAIRVLLGAPRQRALRYGTPLVLAACLLPLTWPHSYFHLRVVLVSLFSALQLFEAVWPLLARAASRETRRASDLLVGITLACGGLMLFVRFVVEATRIESVSALFVATPVETLVFVYIALISTVSSIGFLSMCNDRYHEELALLASTDPLTELSNRRGLVEHVERALALARRTGTSVALIALDVDHFKRINDRYGHDTGDQVLISVAQRLRRSVRSHDLLARSGGEEFMVVLSDATEADAVIAAERLRAAVEEPNGTESMPLRTTISAGVAALSGDRSDVDVETARQDLFGRADRALYGAKERGRNRVVAASELEAERAREPRSGVSFADVQSRAQT